MTIDIWDPQIQNETWKLEAGDTNTVPGSAGVLSTVLACSDSHSLHSGTAKYNVG